MIIGVRYIPVKEVFYELFTFRTLVSSEQFVRAKLQQTELLSVQLSAPASHARLSAPAPDLSAHLRKLLPELAVQVLRIALRKAYLSRAARANSGDYGYRQ